MSLYPVNTLSASGKDVQGEEKANNKNTTFATLQLMNTSWLLQAIMNLAGKSNFYPTTTKKRLLELESFLKTPDDLTITKKYKNVRGLTLAHRLTEYQKTILARHLEKQEATRNQTLADVIRKHADSALGHTESRKPKKTI